MNKKQEIFLEITQKIDEGEIFLVGFGEDMNLDIEEVIALSPLYQEKKEMIEQLSDVEVNWVKRSIYQYELEIENDAVKKQMAYLNAVHFLVGDKPYFVVNQCTDGVLSHSQFDQSKCVSPCGSVLLGQCVDLVPVYKEIYQVLEVETDPAELSMKLVEKIPSCEHCKKDIVLNTVVENQAYCEAAYLDQWAVYTKWLEHTLNRHVVILELGVGFETPTVARWPFEKIAFFNQKAYLIRVHERLFQLTEEMKGKASGIGMQPKKFITTLCGVEKNMNMEKQGGQDDSNH